MSRAKELREKRAQIAAQMAEVLTEIHKEDTTPEKRTELRAKWAKMDAEQTEIKADVDVIERQDAIDAELRGQRVRPAGDGAVAMSFEQRKEEYRKAFFRALSIDPRSGIKGLKPSATMLQPSRGNSTEYDAGLRWLGESNEAKEVMDRCLREQTEQRDNIAGTQSLTYTQGAAGGYFVPVGFVQELEVATKYFAPMADGSIIRVIDTAGGGLLPWPTNNDTQQAWAVLGETTQITDQAQTANYPTQGTAPSGNAGNLTAGVVNFGAWKGSTGLVRISIELLQDSAFDLQAFLRDSFARRQGLGYEYYLTRGSGVNQPTGILTATVASGQAATIAAGSSANDGGTGTGANSIGTNDLVGLEHAINPAYRRNGKYMFHDDTLKVLKQLLDKYGRPLWVPGLTSGAPDTIYNYPYVVNQSMPKIAAAANTILFGDFQKFVMRRVKDLAILRLDERFADNGEVAFVAFSRIDSNLVDAGVHPIAFLQQHS